MKAAIWGEEIDTTKNCNKFKCLKQYLLYTYSKKYAQNISLLEIDKIWKWSK